MDGTRARTSGRFAATAAVTSSFATSGQPGRRLLALGFVGFLVYVPLVHVLSDLLDGRVPQAFALFDAPLDSEALRHYETSLLDDSPVVRSMRQRTQSFFTSFAGRGNAKVHVGRDGWLFYRPAVDHVTGPGFLATGDGRGALPAAGVTCDPLSVVLDFHDQLAEAGIELIVVPVPGKSTIYPERLAADFPVQSGPPVNRDLRRFVASLERRGVTVLDPSGLLWQAKTTSSRELYLPRDTHWSPAGMTLVAGQIANCLRSSACVYTASRRPLTLAPASLVQRGDLDELLVLPDQPDGSPLASIAVERVDDATTGRPNVYDPASPVLLMGDSFTLIYSRRDAELHAAAGLGDRLAYELGFRIDVLARDGGDPNYIRRRLAEQPRRLDGKRVVVWQFAQRWLTTITWERVRIPEQAVGRLLGCGE